MIHHTPIVPKSPDGTARIVTIARVSTPHQDIKMLDVQADDVEKVVKEYVSGPYALTRLVEHVCAEYRSSDARRQRELTRIDNELGKLRDKRKRLAKAIADGTDIKEVKDLFDETEVAMKALTDNKTKLTAVSHDEMPALNPEHVLGNLETVLIELMATSYDFNELLRPIVVEFKIEPLQAVDSGKPVARGHVVLDFHRFGKRPREIVKDVIESPVQAVLDFWDPSPHVACLADVKRLRVEHPAWSAEKIGNAIGGVKRWTVRRTLKLAEKMESLGVESPYQRITDPSEVSRWRLKNGGKPRWNQT